MVWSDSWGTGGLLSHPFTVPRSRAWGVYTIQKTAPFYQTYRTKTDSFIHYENDIWSFTKS